MSYTLTETGIVMTETQQDVTLPVDYSFATVNYFVNHPMTAYEELQSLCLGMASYIEQLRIEGKIITDVQSRTSLALTASPTSSTPTSQDVVRKVRIDVLNMPVSMWDALDRCNLNGFYIGTARNFLETIGLPGGKTALYNAEERLFFDEIYRIENETN